MSTDPPTERDVEIFIGSVRMSADGTMAHDIANQIRRSISRQSVCDSVLALCSALASMIETIEGEEIGPSNAGEIVLAGLPRIVREMLQHTRDALDRPQ